MLPVPAENDNAGTRPALPTTANAVPYLFGCGVMRRYGRTAL
ncbi:Uncharacterised protein [Bordetella ansorpii]|uniref:Uncharacterized protein n=1 Tax=Bordetella ansorpii TaxID=288768 RepID=A0A157SCY8_9BORD|nr:Uncharacterised protein [Bordetella ansorpii]